jgi:alpha-L-fucosidase 2
LRARGGFDVDLAWKDGHLTTATIQSRLGNECRIRTERLVDVKTRGRGLPVARPMKNLIEFKTESGREYTLLPSESPVQ